jgi:hypothetical protein
MGRSVGRSRMLALVSNAKISEHHHNKDGVDTTVPEQQPHQE